MQGEGTQSAANQPQMDAPTHTIQQPPQAQSAESVQQGQQANDAPPTPEAKVKRLLLLVLTVLAWSRFPLLRWPFAREAAWTLMREIRIRRPVAACIQFVRSRRWLTSALTVCTSILALVIYIEQDPAHEGELPFDESMVVFDDVLSHDEKPDLDKLTQLTDSPLQTVLQAAGLQQDPEMSQPGPNQPVLVADTDRSESAASPPSGDFTADDAPRIRGAWLTGVIETVPEDSTVSRVAGLNDPTQSRN